ncbi:MAG: DUF3108 domain-containing protein [gamma proteobacterium symbiont of Ctena orbiculata]|nr:MAG: DUF3108 domain-containing protein [gamma proteobacterium symbiont of Ctena orbiculata]
MAWLRSHIGWLLGLATVTCSMTMPAETALQLKPFSAGFSVKRNLLPLGELRLELSLNEQGDYAYQAHTRPGMLAGWFSADEVIEESRGHLRPGTIQPIHYSYRDQADESESSVLEFDWGSGEVHTTSGGIRWSQPIARETQDRLSQQLLVRLHLAQGRRQITYQVADGGKIKQYHFRVDGEDQIDTPYGEMRCLRVLRSKGTRKPDYTIWFAPQLDYLPVRIERQQSGRLYRMVLDEINLDGAAK